MLSLFKKIDSILFPKKTSDGYSTDNYKDSYKDSYSKSETAEAIKSMDDSSDRIKKSTAIAYFNTGNRKDKKSQNAMEEDIANGNSISVSAPQSSRYKISKKDQKEKGLSKNGTLYTADDIADMQVDPKKEVSVASSAIDSFDYDPQTGDLDVKFKGGKKKYNYPKVPPEVVTEWMNSPSKGKYMNYEIAPNYSTNK